MPAMTVTLVAAMACVATGHAAPPSAVAVCQPAPSKRVLVIGNSLTYANDLPAMVTALGLAAHESLSVVTIAFPNYSLQDHWDHGPARQAITGACWDVVVLQQGPSALRESRTLLVDYARRFSTLARAVGATPALYMVWPARDRLTDLPRSSESYRIAAVDVRGVLLPVGDAWRAAWHRDSSLALFAADGLHPSVLGSYLAALVITAQLIHRSPIGMAAELVFPTGTSLCVPSATAAVLQEAAADADNEANAPATAAALNL